MQECQQIRDTPECREDGRSNKRNYRRKYDSNQGGEFKIFKSTEIKTNGDSKSTKENKAAAKMRETAELKKQLKENFERKFQPRKIKPLQGGTHAHQLMTSQAAAVRGALITGKAQVQPHSNRKHEFAAAANAMGRLMLQQKDGPSKGSHNRGY